MTLPRSTNGGANSSRVLIVGAAGFIGQFIAEASLKSGHWTFILVRSIPSCPTKAKALKGFKDDGATIIHGAINNQELMEKILKEHKIDIVISAVGGANILDQLVLIRAIQAVGTIKRFLPSEFGHDVDRADPVEPGLSMYNEKRKVRRVVEDAGIPYTYICCNSIASWPYYDNTHPSEVSPPLDHFQIYGDGNVKAYFVAGPDIGKFTIKAAADIRTLKKSLHFRPSCNYLNINELASLWEKKIGRNLPRITLSEDHLLDAAKEKIIPQSVVASFTHDIFFNGCQINYAIDGADEVEVTNLYPEETFTTMDEWFNGFIIQMNPVKNRIHG
ncbi:leucoanthocyanidin reductase 1 [Dorcoceras hygrometricum]|uniref:Leucoanthocyanidin reductase 1 n=1 Tax=Dorcoceras hygrometricum TaxID=472368 RepID=A0A2Z7BAZ5_9LAMI|nr:leucoanthocyanidin reductase 1 [Dorcoceras hygrometricum]